MQGRRSWVPILGGALVVVAGLAGCATGPAVTHQQQAVANPPVVVSPASPTSDGGQPVRVEASIGVPGSRAVAALVPFVQAHAESVNAGRVTADLVSATTPAELARQRQVVAFASAQGFLVPSTPVLRVVSVLDRSASVARFGICLWLPSTEYVDARTGRPPNGPVPQTWAPAVATVRLANLTWSVDNLREPDNETTIGCGSNP